MKKLIIAAIIAITALSAGLYADETYPDWTWTVTGWVYTGNGVDPIPPPPPIKK